MAIAKVDRPSPWVVYWRDHETKKKRSKCFRDRKNAELFQKAIKSDLARDRLLENMRAAGARGESERHTVEVSISPPTDIQQLALKCSEMYASPANTIPDIFDFLMEVTGLPVRFKDVLALARDIHKGERKMPAGIRAKVLTRDNHRCRWCGATATDARLHVDHIVPLSRGGMTEERNLQVLCEQCNIGKGGNNYHMVKG